MPEHGGKRLQASLKYGIPEPQWLDLSTGINPNGWPVPNLPDECWQRLPEEEDGLIEAAAGYYRVAPQQILPVAGSQAVIQHLPALRQPCRVTIVEPAYNEHRFNWERLGHKVQGIPVDKIGASLPDTDILVLVNPNNPTTTTIDPEQLRQWHRSLAQQGGWLIVDEAYMDSTPELSLTPDVGAEGLILLRSLGKFFGLAGIRVGFMLAPPQLLSAMAEELGPWQLTTPSRWIARQALADTLWQDETRTRLRQQQLQLEMLLRKRGFHNQSCALFSWFSHPQSATIAHQLAEQGILVRYFPETESIRIGLPGNKQNQDQLVQALKRLQI